MIIKSHNYSTKSVVSFPKYGFFSKFRETFLKMHKMIAHALCKCVGDSTVQCAKAHTPHPPPHHTTPLRQNRTPFFLKKICSFCGWLLTRNIARKFFSCVLPDMVSHHKSVHRAKVAHCTRKRVFFLKRDKTNSWISYGTLSRKSSQTGLSNPRKQTNHISAGPGWLKLLTQVVHNSRKTSENQT